MLEQADPLARLLAGSGQPFALGRFVGEDVVRVFQAPQTTARPCVAVEDGERDVAVLPLRGPDEIEVIQDQARAPQLQIGSDHLPRVQPGPGRVAAEAAAVGIDREVARIDAFGGGGMRFLKTAASTPARISGSAMRRTKSDSLAGASAARNQEGAPCHPAQDANPRLVAPDRLRNSRREKRESVMAFSLFMARFLVCDFAFQVYLSICGSTACPFIVPVCGSIRNPQKMCRSPLVASENAAQVLR